MTESQLVLIDNTVLTNFALVKSASLVMKVWPDAASTTAAVKTEYWAGISGGRFSEEDWPDLPILELSVEEERFSAALSARLGLGEKCCLAVAFHRGGLVATADLLARKAARRHRIGLTGTLGVLILCVEREILTVDRGNQLLRKMIDEGYRSPSPTLDQYLRQS